jgi:hypothetical protein
VADLYDAAQAEHCLLIHFIPAQQFGIIGEVALLNFDGFAPASQWEELAPAPTSQAPAHEAAL